jgi:thiol-disulfide isomerase/thioredoxin
VDLSIPEGFEVGNRLPEFAEQDTAGNPLALAAYRGRVTMVDFWATWCGPCLVELPNVMNDYRAYHAQGFEIIGVSLDDDANNLRAFTKVNSIPWVQFFDGLGWRNKLAVKYGITSIPASFLLNRHGVIIAKNLRGAALGVAVNKALGEH